MRRTSTCGLRAVAARLDLTPVPTDAGPAARPAAVISRYRRRRAVHPGDEQRRDTGHGGHPGHRQPGTAQGQQYSGHRRPGQAGRTFGPACHHVGRGELVGRADDGGQEGGLRRSGDGEAEGGERRQQVDRQQRCAEADGSGNTGHRQRLEPVARAQDPARTAAIGKGADERADHDARDQLDQHHGHARRRAAVLVGDDQQDQPDSELCRAEQRVGDSHHAQGGVAERRPEDREDDLDAFGHRRPGWSTTLLCRAGSGRAGAPVWPWPRSSR